jgi:hypothetical protein
MPAMEVFIMRLFAAGKRQGIVYPDETQEQLLRLRWIIVIIFAISSCIVLGMYALSKVVQVHPSDLTRDAASVVGAPLYIGMLSTLGNLLWACSSAICFLGYWIARDNDEFERSSRFLLSFGILSAVLTIDDGFLLHETVFPDYLGVPGILVYLVYFLAVGGCLLYFVPTILRTDYILLALSLLFMGLSIVMDVFVRSSNIGTFIEDGCKFIGILFWLIYLARTVGAMIRRSSTSLSRGAKNPA